MMGLLLNSAGTQAGEPTDAKFDSRAQHAFFWLQPFQWKNPGEDPSKQTLADVTPAIAADVPQQPTSLQPVSSKQEVQRLMPTQPDDSSTAVPAAQGRNPFHWTNSAEPVGNFTDSTQQEQPILPKPFYWSNDLQGAEPPRDLTPPEEPSLRAALLETMQWQQPGAAELADSSTDDGQPPANATDEQLAEWEQEKFPWIRPFYWSNDQSSAQLPPPDLSPTDPSMPLLARPFQWTNSTELRTTATRDSLAPLRVAFFQEDEELPPLPPRGSDAPNPLPPVDQQQSDGSRSPKKLSSKDTENQSGDDEKGVLAEAETLGHEPEDNSLQFLRASTVLLKPGDSQYDWGMTYSLIDLTLPVIANSTLELARFRRRELLVPLEVRYGLARRIQLFLNVPFGWSNTELAFSSFEEFENDGGIGDITFGGTFLLRQGNGEKSDAILTVAATAPTGEDPFSPVGQSPSAPALGGGTWAISVNSLFIRNYDPVVVFYGFGTRQHFLRELNGQTFRAGEEYNYQMGVGFGVNERITLSTRFNGSYVTETRLDGQRILGSIQEPMTVGLAMTIARKKRLVEPFIDFGLTNDSNDVRFGITWTR